MVSASSRWSPRTRPMLPRRVCRESRSKVVLSASRRPDVLVLALPPRASTLVLPNVVSPAFPVNVLFVAVY